MFEESVTSVPSIWTTVNSWFTPAVLFVLLNLMIGTIAITSSLGGNKPNNDHRREERRQLARSPTVLQRLRSINLYAYRSQGPASVPAVETPPEAETHYVQRRTREQDPPLLPRSPSMLQRLKSIRLCSYVYPEPTPSAETHFGIPREEEERAVAQPLRSPPAPTPTPAPEPAAEEENDGGHSPARDEDSPTLDEVYNQLKSSHVSRTKSDTKPSAGELPPKLPTKMRKSASVKSAFGHFEEQDVAETRRPASVREATEEADDEVDARADDFINRFKQQLKLQRIDSIMRYKEMIARGTAK